MRNIKKIISIGLVGLVSSLSAGDFNLNISEDKVEVDATESVNNYSLLERESLNSGDWVKTQNAHGTGSNLLFNIDTTAQTKFYRVSSSNEPIAPTNFYHKFGGDGRAGYFEKVMNDVVINYDTNSIDVNVTWVETPNPLHIPVSLYYLGNLPFTQTLTNGPNLVHSTLMVSGAMGLSIDGNINIERIDAVKSIDSVTIEDKSQQVEEFVKQ